MSDIINVITDVGTYDARQPDFGWSYPPGCNSVPADEEEPDESDATEGEYDPFEEPLTEAEIREGQKRGYW